jgi:hypothetical protein
VKYDRTMKPARCATAIDETLALTRDEDARVRAEALRRLCPCHVRANIPQIWDRVLEMVDDPEARIRRHILHLLCDGSPREREQQVLGALGRFAHDDDERLRRRARGVLAQHKRTGRVNVL